MTSVADQDLNFETCKRLVEVRLRWEQAEREPRGRSVLVEVQCSTVAWEARVFRARKARACMMPAC